MQYGFDLRPPYTISPVFEQALLLVLRDLQLATNDISGDLPMTEALVEWTPIERDLSALAPTSITAVLSDDT